MIPIIVDDIEISVAPGSNLLQACLDNGIYVPHLCHVHEASSPWAGCRLCLVAIEGHDRPLTACTHTVNAAVRVRTDTPEVRRLQRSALNLLLSVHHVDCRNCPANRRCALQDIARFLKVKLKPQGLTRTLKTPAVDSTHPCLDHYPNRCVLCTRCLQACRRQNGHAHLSLARRGFNTVISAHGAQPADAETCDACHACIDACPVGALVVRTAAPEAVGDVPE